MTLPIIGWARTPVVPVGGALSRLQPHELGAPVLRRLMRDAGLPPEAVDAVILGNALGAGGNPARMLALAADLPDACAAISIDSQCCAGLDAIGIACGLLASGQAEIVVAGGAEAWSRAPLRYHRQTDPHTPPRPYDQPAFAPDPARDPDMLAAAASFAHEAGLTRASQDTYAADSHARAVASRAVMAAEIEALAGQSHDSYPRLMDPSRLARMPTVAGQDPRFALSTLAVSPKADGAALILLATDAACRRWGLQPRARWHASASVGGAPETPMRCAEPAARRVLERAGWPLESLACIELHDAFAAQGLDFCQSLPFPAERLNVQGGGLARGHPIGASGAIALVRLLAQLSQQSRHSPLRGLACVAGAGGIGAAIAVETIPTSSGKK